MKLEPGSQEKAKPTQKGADDPSPFSYNSTFRDGRYKLPEQRPRSTAAEDQALVSSFVDELLRNSVAGREFAKNSLSVRNATRPPGEDISTEM